jgi:acyl carrier protein
MPSSLEEVQSILARLLEVDRARLVPQARLREDLGADSLDLIELILIFEDELGVEIPIIQMRTLQATVGSAAASYEAYRSGKK